MSGLDAAWEALDADLRDVIAEGDQHQFLASPDYAIARHRPLIEAAIRDDTERLRYALSHADWTGDLDRYVATFQKAWAEYRDVEPGA